MTFTATPEKIMQRNGIYHSFGIEFTSLYFFVGLLYGWLDNLGQTERLDILIKFQLHDVASGQGGLDGSIRYLPLNRTWKCPEISRFDESGQVVLANVVNLCFQDILVYTHDINREIQTFLTLATCHRSPQTWHIWHDVAGIFHLGPPYAQCPILRGFLSHGGPQVIFQDQWPFVIEKPMVKRGVLRCFGHIQMEQNNWDVSRIWGFSAANMRFQQTQWFTLVQWLNSGCTSG